MRVPSGSTVWRSGRGLPALILTGLLVASAARGNDPAARVIPLPAPGDSEWRPLAFRSIERETRYALEWDPAGRPAYRATSECGASAMLLPLPEDIDLAWTPRLTWRWRIERGLAIEREQTAQADDFAARVYVLFRFDAERASRWQRFQHRLGARIFGAEMPGQTLSYVWSSRMPVGRSWTRPRHRDAQLVVAETDSSGAAGGPWREAVVDLTADARRVFTTAPRLQPYALGLMTDADDVCQTAIAWYSDFRLLGPDALGREDVVPDPA